MKTAEQLISKIAILLTMILLFVWIAIENSLKGINFGTWMALELNIRSQSQFTMDNTKSISFPRNSKNHKYYCIIASNKLIATTVLWRSFLEWL